MSAPSSMLLIDAAGPLVQTGLWAEGRWLGWEASREEAGRSIFRGVSALLAQSGRSVEDIGGFFFCEGPGSMLGIRMGAMAIHGWQALSKQPQPVFLYSSHAALARILLARGIPPPFHVISDARRQRWNLFTVRDGSGHFQRMADAELSRLAGPFFRMEEVVRRPPPVEAETIPYDLHEQASIFLQSDLLRQSNGPDLPAQEAPAYKKWMPERRG